MSSVNSESKLTFQVKDLASKFKWSSVPISDGRCLIQNINSIFLSIDVFRVSTVVCFICCVWIMLCLFENLFPVGCKWMGRLFNIHNAGILIKTKHLSLASFYSYENTIVVTNYFQCSMLWISDLKEIYINITK